MIGAELLGGMLILYNPDTIKEAVIKTMTFNELLKKEKAIFDEMAKEHKGYDKTAYAVIVAFNKRYRATYPDKYPYNDSIVDFILSQVDVVSELIDYLKTEVYLSQRFIEDEKKNQEEIKMAEKGFIRIKLDTIKDIPVQGRAVIFHGGIFGRQEIKTKIIENKGSAFFLPGKARRRGYSAFTLATSDYPAYYKIIN